VPETSESFQELINQLKTKVGILEAERDNAIQSMKYFHWRRFIQTNNPILMAKHDWELHQEHRHTCAIKIQAQVRQAIARLKYARVRGIVMSLQVTTREQLQAMKLQVVVLQALFRGHLIREQNDQLRMCTTAIQKFWRGFQGRSRHANFVQKLIKTRQKSMRSVHMLQRAERQRQKRQRSFEVELLRRATHLKQLHMANALRPRRKPQRVIDHLSQLSCDELAALQQDLGTKNGVDRLKERVWCLRLQNRQLRRCALNQPYPVSLQQSMRSLDTEALLRRRALPQDEAVLLRVKRLHHSFQKKTSPVFLRPPACSGCIEN
jgi:hypothetical protein